MDRRKFLLGLGGSLAATSVSVEPSVAAEPREPKSTHTFFDGLPTDLYAFDVDLKVTHFPADFGSSELFFPAVQVGFDKLSEWAHGGLQWAGPDASGNNHLANWGGGYTDRHGVDHYGRDVTGQPMSIVKAYPWVAGRWYRYRVWLIAYNPDANIYRWGFWIYDYVTKVDTYIGFARTRSANINGVMVWMETGYGVTCSDPKLRIVWRNPIARSRAGTELRPPSAYAGYNGTCWPARTNQAVLINRPDLLTWFQAAGVNRTVWKGAQLW